jgi:osmotically-inducible protein OsmY
MRTLFVFLVGIAVGAIALYWYQTQPQATHAVARGTSSVSNSSRDAADHAWDQGRAVASDMSARVSEKMQEWHLTGPDIHAELQKTGEVVRQNTAKARDRVNDVRIVAVIKAKFVLDRDLSAGAITVESTDGNVTLSGTVAAEYLVGRAVADALDTDGVNHVVSKLEVGSK